MTEDHPFIEVGQVWLAEGHPSRKILGLVGTIVRYRYGLATTRRIQASRTAVAEERNLIVKSKETIAEAHKLLARRLPAHRPIDMD